MRGSHSQHMTIENSDSDDSGDLEMNQLLDYMYKE